MQAVAPPVLSPASSDAASALIATPRLDGLIASTKRCVFQPMQFFVSWSGVLTLAYAGFPPEIEELKRKLEEELPSLPKENPGSKWPKTTLGCVRDGHRLTQEQLQKLQRICHDDSAVFADSNFWGLVAVLDLSVVLYEARSLERNRRLSVHTVALAPLGEQHEGASHEGTVLLSAPSADEAARTRAVTAEMDDPGYWFHASKDGNREHHYRGACLGLTLVHDLKCFAPTAEVCGGGAGGSDARRKARSMGALLALAVRQFRARVDAELPGLYTWFDDNSLHITVRALMG